MLKGLGNLGDMAKLMQKAQQVQEKIAEAQRTIAEIEVEGVAGAGMVRARVGADGTVRALNIDASLLSGEEEKAVVEDLVVAAINDAAGRAKDVAKEEMAKATEGLPLPPGMQLPFG
ncbi:MAG: YbaB/EbfC family nucleoid-associated protein [Pikeienuella sp.]